MPWLLLVHFNALGITAFEFVDTVTQRSRWPQNYPWCNFSGEILSVNDASTLSPHCHSPFILVFNVYAAIRNPSGKTIVCWRLVSCDSGPESESAKFYRLQLRLRLQENCRLRPTPTPAFAPTPQPPWWKIQGFQKKRMLIFSAIHYEINIRCTKKAHLCIAKHMAKQIT